MARLLFAALLVTLFGWPVPADEPRPDDVLVRVNGGAITRADLEFEFVTAGVPEGQREAVRRRSLESLVDARLLAGFLKKRKVQADPRAVDEEVHRLRRRIAQRDVDPNEVLQQVGYDDATLREKLALPLAWDAYAEQVVRPEALRTYWELHHDEFDGTRVRARQILIRLPAAAESAAVEAAREKLEDVRLAIDNGEIEMAAAAREHSDAPSGKQGGDVGWFPYRGKMPASFTDPVFALPDMRPGVTTAPFRSPFGMHLVEVTAVEPGTYSLEDVREQVRDAFADEVRAKLIEKEREAATIEWVE